MFVKMTKNGKAAFVCDDRHSPVDPSLWDRELDYYLLSLEQNPV